MLKSSKNILKSSQFNEYLGCIMNEFVVYNNLSSAMIEVSESTYKALINCQLYNLSDQTITGLRKGHFIVEKNKNEIEEIRKRKIEIQENNTVIGLQILPLFRCNFNCTYCFQKPIRNEKVMPKNVMDGIISWLEGKIKSTTKVLNIMWFGGEPLLALDQFKYLSKNFIDITDARNIRYYSNIITNGYLLNNSNIQLLLENGVKSAMVTIDGTEKVHDGRRMLKNGGKTWRVIIDNLKKALNRGLSVTIRINIDKTNINAIDHLLEDLEKERILNDVGYFFGLISHFGNACSSIQDNLLSMEETDKILKQKKIMDILSRANNFKYRVPADLVGCVASAKHSYVVCPSGELYKCSKTIGDQKEECGNILNPDSNHPNFIKWLDIDNFNIKLCSSCSMIPVCRGKVCAYDVMNKLGRFEQCNKKRDHKTYIESLKRLYLNKKEDLI